MLPILAALASCSILAGVVAGDYTLEASTASAAATSDAGALQTAAVVSAASDFLRALDPEQRRRAQLFFSPQTTSAARFPHVAPPGGQRGRGPSGMRLSGLGGPRQGPQDDGPHDHGPPPGDLGGPGGPGGRAAMPDCVNKRYGQAVWSNYPVSDVPRPGLRLGALTAAQRDAAMKLLRTLLSPQSYAKVLE